MNISRKQLYELGEPFGESATRLKPGGRVYGGGGSNQTPETQTQISELPEWARGYAKDTLSKASALTDINKNPYQQYGGERIAGFQPMQQQAFESAATMRPSEQLGLGTSLAGAAGLGALGTNYQGGRFQGGQFNTQAAEEYMNPYTQKVVDYQKAQALRDFQIAQPMRQAQAVQQGAFGGSRSAIVDAEAQRALNSQLQGIEATGQQAAFQNAQQQFNADQARRLQAQQMGEQSRQYGAGLGLQGLQTGLQAAGQLGQLGQTEYGQRMGITGLQSQFGAQQQQQAQRPLDVAYQDFLNQQNYPYKQLGFMSDMIRGLPLGQQSTSQIYSPPPSTAQTVASLGVGAAGLSKAGVFGAEGGLMESYADGGVTSDQNVESILSKLSDQQLAQAKEAALNRQDVEQAQMIDAEMAERASIRGGLGSAFNQLPVNQQEQMMAGGGIVAFAPGGPTYLDQSKKAQEEQLGYIDQATTQPSIEDQKANILKQQEMLKGIYPESVLPKYLEETKAERAKLSAQFEKDSGFAMVLAAADLLEGSSLYKSGAKAARTYISEVNRLKSENKKADSLLRQSEIQLATAKELHDNGMVDKAVARAEKGQDLKAKAAELKAGVAGDSAKILGQLEGTKLGADASRYAAELGYKGHLASAAATMNKPSAQKEGAMAIFNDPSFAPGKPPEERYRLATERYLEMTKTGLPGVNTRIEASAREKAVKDFNDAIAPGGSARKEYRELQKKGTPEQVKEFEDQLFNKFLIMHSGGAAPAPGATQQAPAAQQQQQAAPPPPLNVWMDAARKANPGVSDADLAKYYNSKYGK